MKFKMFVLVFLLSQMAWSFDFGNTQGSPPNIGRFIGVKNVGDSILDVSPNGYSVHLEVSCGGVNKGITPLVIDSSFAGQFCYTQQASSNYTGIYAYTFAVSISIQKVDTISSTEKDTIRILDTVNIMITDTVSVLKTDTIQFMDTLWFRDTIKTTDTLFIPDTIHKYVHDTVSVCEYNKSVSWQQRLYRSKGVSEQKQAITLETEPGSSPSVEFETSENVHVNVYIYDNLGTYVTSGRFEILPSNHKQYLKFNGLSKHGSRVVDGVFLMRVITHHNGNTTNTIYNVGISNK